MKVSQTRRLDVGDKQMFMHSNFHNFGLKKMFIFLDINQQKYKRQYWSFF
jgi:hypothetical protein